MSTVATGAASTFGGVPFPTFGGDGVSGGTGADGLSALGIAAVVRCHSNISISKSESVLTAQAGDVIMS